MTLLAHGNLQTISSMGILVVNHRDVDRLLPMAECIDVMETAMRCTALGTTRQLLRFEVRLPAGTGKLTAMLGCMNDPDCFGAKLVSVFPQNFNSGQPSHQGAVILYESKWGRPVAIMDGRAITRIRTAATSALATRLLARANARTLAILGYGEQARAHLEAIQIVRAIDGVRVWGRSGAKAREFAATEGARHGIAIMAASTAEEAVRDADVICTTTAATEPILRGAWLAPGMHVNAVGSGVPYTTELDAEAVAKSRFIVDLKEAALAQAGEFLDARRRGLVGDNHIQAELGEVLIGRKEGRVDDQDITIFKSLGIVAEDLAAAHYVYGKAKSQGVGVLIDL